MMDGWRKEDPATTKMLPVEADVPEAIATLGQQPGATELMRAVGDLALIAFYFLLRVGEYTTKATRNNSKQTEEFEMEDITFFEHNALNQKRQLSRKAADSSIMNACAATLRLKNQKNGWKNVCIHQDTNGDNYMCPVRALGRRYVHVRTNVHDFERSQKHSLSSYFDGTNNNHHVNQEHMSHHLKVAAAVLDYDAGKGIPIERVNTHSLRGGGANALSLSGYSDRQIQKMGRWKSATFMEYIREELGCFSEGMSTSMKQRFNFVNVAGGACHDITDTAVTMEYDMNAAAA